MGGTQALSAEGLENLVAFTRLLGYVRFFHPSDEAASADWDAFALAGVDALEGPADAGELAATLQTLFAPVAPTLRLAVGGAPEPAPIPSGERVLAWWHHGLGTEKAKHYSPYESERVDVDALTPSASLRGSVEHEPPEGSRIRFSASVSSEGGRARAELRLHDAEGEKLVETEGAWGRAEADAVAPAGVSGISFGVRMDGEGLFEIEEPSLEIDGESLEVFNADFSETIDDGLPPLGWALRRDAPFLGHVCESRPPTLVVEHRADVAFPTPDEPWTAELGRGVWCSLPLALPADASATLPRGEGEVLELSVSAPSGDDRTTRLAVVALAWTRLQHFYPYFDVVDVDWDEVLRDSLRRAATDTDRSAFVRTLWRLVAALRDGHGWVGGDPAGPKHLPPVRCAVVEDEVVVTVVGEGVDELRRGDVVETIDGRPTRELLEEEARFISAAASGWMRARLSVNLLAGPEGERVRLGLRSNGGERTSELERSVPWAEAFGPGRDTETIAEIQPGIWYLDLDRISDDEFREALPKLRSAEGIVFDVRGYPKVSTVALGHLIRTPIACARWHIPIVLRPDREGMIHSFSNWTVLPEEPYLDAPRVFCIDGWAMSWAETFLGMVEHHRLGELVGEPTAGTNGNVASFRLPGDYGVQFTGMKVLKADASRHHGVGILPTVPVSPTVEGLIAGRDEILERAIEVVRAKGSNEDAG